MATPPLHPFPGPSRERILDLLAWEPLTVDELADRVGLTPNGIRAQLTTLERDGQVERAGLRHAGTAGKPPVLYSLTRHATESRSAAYAPTLQALVKVMRDRLDRPALEALLRETGEQLGRDHRGMDPTDLLSHLGATVSRQVSDDGGIRLQGARCPLAEAVRQEPLTCEVVRSMLASAVGTQVTMHCEHGDSPRCCFDIAHDPE